MTTPLQFPRMDNRHVARALMYGLIAEEYLRQNSVTLDLPPSDWREIPAHVAAQAMEAR